MKIVGNRFASILANRKFVDWTHLSAKLYKGNLLWPLAPKEGAWGGKWIVIGLNHYKNFSANNVEEQNSGDIHMLV